VLRNQSFHAFWVTPPCEIPPKHRQLRAPRPKLAGNAYNSLVDLPDDGTESIIDGRDGKVDATDDNSAVNASQHVSTTAASPEQLRDDAAQLVQITNLYTSASRAPGQDDAWLT
jgi:hypothetical protein